MTAPVPGTGICVVGMARSGTSLAARALGLLGVDLGDPSTLIPADEQNATGYWEQETILALDDAVLRTLGGSWDEPPFPARGWEHAPRRAFLRRRAAALLAELFHDAPAWAFKDTRASYTAPLWRTVVPGLRFVVCVRNPSAVEASYAAFVGAKGRRDVSGLRLWVRATASAIDATADACRTLLDYDAFIASPHEAVDALGRLASTEVTPDARDKVVALARGDLNHHVDAAPARGESAERRAAGALWSAITRGEDVNEAARSALQSLGESPTPDPPLHLPRAIADVPRDLTLVDRFGVREDGWLGPVADLLVAGGPPATLVLRCDVLPAPAQALEIRVDDAPVATVEVPAGLASVRVGLPAAAEPRHLELRWRQALPARAPDTALLTARLRSLRLLPALSPP